MFPIPVVCPVITPIFFNATVVMFDNVKNKIFRIVLSHYPDGI